MGDLGDYIPPALRQAGASDLLSDEDVGRLLAHLDGHGRHLLQRHMAAAERGAYELGLAEGRRAAAQGAARG